MANDDQERLGQHPTTAAWVGNRLVANRYRLDRPIGEGAMGVVWRARDEEMNRLVAIKVLADSMRRDVKGLHHLRREAQMALGLHHPHIVGIQHLETGVDGVFLVMEFIEGPSLAERLAEVETLSPADVVVLAAPLCDALAYAHARGVIHRDIKPANILLAADGPKLADFGIAVSVRETLQRLTRSGPAGTLPYMAPEQIRGQHLTERTDIYQFAATLYECLSGQPPFHRGTIEWQILNRPVAPLTGVPEPLASAVIDGLAKDPAQRPKTVRQFAALLRAAPGQAPEVVAQNERRVPLNPKPSENRAQRLLAVIEEIHRRGRAVIGPRWTLLTRMQELASQGDVEGMRRYYEACLRDPKGRGVGRRLDRAGCPSLETEHGRFLEIYRENQENRREAVQQSQREDHARQLADEQRRARQDEARRATGEHRPRAEAAPVQVGKGTEARRLSKGAESAVQREVAWSISTPATVAIGAVATVLIAGVVLYLVHMGSQSTSPSVATPVPRPEVPQAASPSAPAVPAPMLQAEAPRVASPSVPSTAVPAPKAAPLRTVTGGGGAPMVLVPAGEFLMGSDDSAEEDERPRHRVYLDAFYIDRYETTNVQYRRFIERTGHRAPRYWGDGSFNDASQPVVGVSWHDADAYCRWAGGRLPTEAEWEKAARGTTRQKYPWGGDWEAGRTNANADKTSPVGSYPRGMSPYGADDMAGNVWEWVADWYDKTYYQRSSERNPKGPESGESKVLRGGAWDFNPIFLRVAARHFNSPVSRFTNIGFRCANGAS
jgi:iron(II)-dependent oxidoreductase